MSHRAKANRHPLLNPPLDGGAGGGGGAASSGLLVHAELRCALCGGGSKAERGALGPLLGPINIASSSSTTATTATGHRRHRTNRPPPLGRYVHRLCALWCPEVFQGADGAYRRVAEAVRRARQIKCAACGKAGAATGCRVHSCPLSFHLPCARDAGCAFNGERFVLACPEHAPMFAREAGAAGAPADEARREDEAEAAATKSNKRPAAASNANNKNNKRGRHRAPPPRLLDAAAIGQRLAGARAALDRAVAKEADPAVAEALRAVFGGGGGAGGSSSAAGPSACPFAAAEAAENSVIDDDEAAFRRKEARRDAKDRARLAPIILGGDVLRRPRCRPRRAVLAVHGPETPESEREEERRRWIPPELGLRAVGGLEDAKRQLFEAAVLPLCHPSIVESLFGGGGNGTATSATTTTSGGTANLAPPRGVLLHGPPGTGKTHLVRAVAGEIARRLAIMVEEEEGFDPEADAAAAEAAAEEIAAGGYYPHHYARGRRPERLPIPTVALFARKGADCLGKYAGDAERSLRLLFDEATRMQPSIIFLDEIDALAPARAARAGTIDQTYASVVATLLALMDGADAGGGAGGGRGKRVVVIAATNRPDAIDPALRRPGRFDREVYVGLPSAEERADILRVMTRGWPCLPRDEDVAAADGNGGNGGNGNAQQQQAAELSALPPALLQELAASTEGYAGADLKALCTGAVMAALRRCAPRCLAAGAEGRARGRAPPLPLGQATTGVGNLRVASPHDEDDDDDDMEDDEDDEDEEQAPAAAATAAEEEEAAAPAAATAPAPTAADPDAAGPSNGNANETNNNTNNNDPNFLHTLRETLADLRSPGTGVVAAAGAPAAAPTAAAAAPTGAAPAAAAPAINLLTRSVSPSPMQHGDSDGADDDESDDDDDDDSDSPSPHALPLHLQRQRPLPPPEQLVVLARDWRAALAAAPPPASLRGADAAPSAGGGAGPGSGAPLPAPLAPLLLPSLARALAQLHASGLPLPRRGRLAVAAAEAARGNLTRLARLLRRCGAIEADDEEEDNGKANSGGNDDNDEEAPTAAATATNAPPPPHGPQCRLLISGDGDAGQAETAAALLRAVRLGWLPRVSPGSENGAAIATAFAAVFPPPVVAALTLPALLLRGRGDAASGCASMVKEALERCSGPRQALVLFAPCVEAWAVAANVVVSGGAGGEEGGEGDGGEGEGAATPTPTPPQPTLAWTVFERALVDASPDRPILVVATTQAPESLLPEGVRRFFFLPTAAAGAADGGTTPATATSTAAASSSTAFARAARAAASRAAAFLRERASDLALAAAGAQEQQQKEGEEQDNADAEDDAEESDPEAAAAAEEALRGWELRVGLNAAQREVADRALAHALACTSALGRALLNPTWAHALNFGFRGAAGAGGGGANGGNNAPTTPPIRAVAERAAEGGYCCLDEMLVDIRLAANAARRAAGLASGAAAAAAAEAAAAQAAEAEAAAAEAPTTTRRPRRGSGRASTAPSTPPPPPVPARYSRAAAAVAAAEDMAEAALAEGAAGLWAAAVGGGGEGGGNGGLGGGGAAALLLQPPGAGAGAGAAGATPIDPAVAAAELRRLMGLAQAAWRSARSAQMEEKWFMGPRPPSSQLVSSDRNKNNNNNKKKKQGEAGAGAAGANKRGRQAAPPSSSPPSSSEEQQQPASAPPLPPPALTPLAALLVGSEAEATADALEAAIAAELRRLLLPAAAKAAAEAAEAAARAAEEGGNDGHDTASVLVPALRQFCRAVGPAWWEATASLAPFGEGVVMEEEEEEEETKAAAAAASTADAALVVAAAARRAARAAARALSP